MLVLHQLVWMISTVLLSDSLLTCYLLPYSISSISSELVSALAGIQSSPARQVICVETGFTQCNVFQTYDNYVSPSTTACSWPTVRSRRKPKFQIQIPRHIQRARRRKRQKLWRRQQRKIADLIRAYKWPYQNEVSSFDNTRGFPGEG